MKFYLTTTLKKTGKTSACIYPPAAWGFVPGDEVSVAVRKAEGTENDPTFTFIATVRVASTAGGTKVTVPKFFGLNHGEWVTVYLEKVGAPNDS